MGRASVGKPIIVQFSSYQTGRMKANPCGHRQVFLQFRGAGNRPIAIVLSPDEAEEMASCLADSARKCRKEEK